MTTEKNIKPHPINPGGRDRNKDTMEKQLINDIKKSKPVNIWWLLISPVVVLILSILLPLVFMLSMKLEVNTALVTEPQEGVLVGAESEEYVTTESIEYSATFVPAGLEDVGGAFQLVEALYGPILMTGAGLDFKLVPPEGNDDLKGYASLKFSRSLIPAIFFFLIILLFFALAQIILNNPNAALRFVPVFTIVWFLYGLLMWRISGWVLGSVNEFLVGLLTEEQGSAAFRLSPGVIYAAPIRIFLVGMVYWLIRYQMAQANTKKVRLNHETADHPKL